MSKTALKTEIRKFDADALRQLIVDLYEARKEAREYLDFFINPDIDKMMARYKAAAEKELGRVTRGKARPRITRLRRLVRDMASFNAGDSYVAELSVFVIETACRVGSVCWIKEPTQRSIAAFLADTLVYVDSRGMSADFFPRVIAAVGSMSASSGCAAAFKRVLGEAIDNFRATV